MALTAKLGDVQLTVPGDAPASRRPSLDLPGLRFVAGRPRRPAATVRGLSLGNRSTGRGRRPAAITVDLNPDDRRQVDLTIDHEADTGATILDAAPRLDLRLDVDWARLGLEPPAVAVTRVLLDAVGGDDGAVRQSADGAVTEVVGGRLTIATDPADAGGTFEVGQCVGRTDAGAFEAIDCP